MGEVSAQVVLYDQADKQDDLNLQSITLLELAQVHYGCGLPAPIQLYVTFEPNRFITRFNMIQQEVQAQMKAIAEEQVEVEVAGEIHTGENGEEFVGGDEGYEDGEMDEGEEGDESGKTMAEDSHDERERRREEYMKQKKEQAEKGEFSPE